MWYERNMSKKDMVRFGGGIEWLILKQIYNLKHYLLILKVNQKI